MTNRLSTTSLVARSGAFARSLARLLPSRQRGGGTMSAARLAPLTLLTALAVAGALFVLYVHPAHANGGLGTGQAHGPLRHGDP